MAHSGTSSASFPNKSIYKCFCTHVHIKHHFFRVPTSNWNGSISKCIRSLTAGSRQTGSIVLLVWGDIFPLDIGFYWKCQGIRLCDGKTDADIGVSNGSKCHLRKSQCIHLFELGHCLSPAGLNGFGSFRLSFSSILFALGRIKTLPAEPSSIWIAVNLIT